MASMRTLTADRNKIRGQLSSELPKGRKFRRGWDATTLRQCGADTGARSALVIHRQPRLMLSASSKCSSAAFTDSCAGGCARLPMYADLLLSTLLLAPGHQPVSAPPSA